MKDKVLVERQEAQYTGYQKNEHKDHWPIRLFVTRYVMMSRKRRKSGKPDFNVFYFVRDMRRLDNAE